jgi:hypothetical protein
MLISPFSNLKDMFDFGNISFSIPSPLLDTPLHSTICLSDFLSGLVVSSVISIILYSLITVFEKKNKSS